MGGGYVILGVSSIWSKDKGLDDFAALSRNSDFVVVLVGLQPQQVEMLKGEAYKDCNLVPICRTQNQQELAMIYSLADVFVNPTYADMFPTVNLEALACGTPVVTYRTGGSPEAIDNKTGVVVEQGNVKALTDAIRQLKKHPLSSADCRERAIAYFNKEISFSNYIKIYDEIIENS